jgi:hypothetical protein
MRSSSSLLLLTALVSLSACEVIGGIFKAGMWVGIVLVVLVLAGLFWIVGKFRR